MLIRRSEIAGTRIVEIDRLVRDGARGPSGRPVRFLLAPADAEVALHSPAFDRQRLTRSFVGEGLLFSDGDHWRERRRIIQPAYPPRQPDHHLDDVHWAVAAEDGTITSIGGYSVYLMSARTLLQSRILLIPSENVRCDSSIGSLVVIPRLSHFHSPQRCHDVVMKEKRKHSNHYLSITTGAHTRTS